MDSTVLRTLRTAAAPSEVVALVEEQLETLSPHAASNIPDACLPFRVKGPGDVYRLHWALSEEVLMGHLPDLERDTQDLILALAAAARRLGELSGAPPEMYTRAVARVD